jgi:hypothetical protein
MTERGISQRSQLGTFQDRLLKNYLQIEIQSPKENQGYSKSPFEKGEFMVISGA